MSGGIDAYPRSHAADLFAQFVAHGEATIQKFIDEQVSEELFIDYKRVTNDGQSTKIEQPDRENLGKAICGFANSEGGVIVWGVDCRKDAQRGDVPSTKHPIHSVKRFLSYLQGATSGCSLPPHDGVRHHAIEIEGTQNGFVVTLVPKSMFAPHQCIVGKYKDRYYVRVGSNFEMAPHGLLAGMFGHQPVPTLFHMWGCGGKTAPQTWAPLITSRPTSTPYVWLGVIIRNHGVTVARDVYTNLQMHLPGPKCQAEIQKRDAEFRSWESVGGWHSISNDQYRLAPGSMVHPWSLTVYLKPPFEAPMQYELSYGCEGSPVHRLVATVAVPTIEKAYSTYTASDRSKEAGMELVQTVMALGRDHEDVKDFEP